MLTHCLVGCDVQVRPGTVVLGLTLQAQRTGSGGGQDLPGVEEHSRSIECYTVWSLESHSLSFHDVCKGFGHVAKPRDAVLKSGMAMVRLALPPHLHACVDMYMYMFTNMTGSKGW